MISCCEVWYVLGAIAGVRPILTGRWNVERTSHFCVLRRHLRALWWRRRGSRTPSSPENGLSVNEFDAERFALRRADAEQLDVPSTFHRPIRIGLPRAHQQPSKSYNFPRFSPSHHTNSVWFWRVREKCELRMPPCYFCVLTCDTSISYKDCMISHDPTYALLRVILGLKWPVKWQ